ncbi:SDR family oxidoreductase [Pararhodobacter sp. SW119]|uniref:SDR family NAD(P)-dependent oxidoreductase n=1 Tax=Pararhodobacter sp. SW119 TaxID=2780075 RepID=UPI001AE0BB5B|nr:SDR family oxidoreductase [Pararhodobacter sp. SW119]
MPGRLLNKVALVFGAGSIGEGWGNGKAAAVAYAREGARVVCADLNAAAADETQRIIEGEGGVAIACAVDVVKFDAITRTVDAALDAFGRVDILHNNVGINEPGGAVDTTEESWDRVMAINAKGMFLTCKAVLPHMERQNSGAIINISSLAAIRYTGYAYASYYASKAAVNQFTRSVAMEFAAKGIRANTIMPGIIDTPHIYQHISGFYHDIEEMRAKRASLSPMKRQGDAWDIAWASVFLASNEAKYITGIELCIDGGLHCKV